jgi:hypothetical protein
MARFASVTVCRSFRSWPTSRVSIPILQPASPGGASPTAMSPLAATRLRGSGEGGVLLADTPKPDERARGDVEGPAARHGEPARGLEDRVEVGARREGFVRGRLGEAVDLRLGPVIGEGGVERGDAGEGGFDRPGQVLDPARFGPGPDGELRAHVGLGEGEEAPVVRPGSAAKGKHEPCGKEKADPEARLRSYRRS